MRKLDKCERRELAGIVFGTLYVGPFLFFVVLDADVFNVAVALLSFPVIILVCIAWLWGLAWFIARRHL